MRKVMAALVLTAGLVGTPVLIAGTNTVSAAGCSAVVGHQTQGTPYYYVKANCTSGGVFRAKAVCANPSGSTVTRYGPYVAAGAGNYSFASCPFGYVVTSASVQQ